MCALISILHISIHEHACISLSLTHTQPKTSYLAGLEEFTSADILNLMLMLILLLAQKTGITQECCVLCVIGWGDGAPA